MTATEYRPKGGMCMRCVKCDWDCSKLPFDTMPSIGAYQEQGVIVKIVRCAEFVRVK